MTAYIIRRLVWAVIILFMLTIAVFFAMRLLPGDPLMIYVAQSQLSSIGPEAMEKLRVEYGLDKPLIVQYFSWAGKVIKGDLGRSIFHNESVGKLIAWRLPITAHIGIVSFVVASILGALSGLLAGLRRGRLADQIVTPLAYVGITVPVFWLGILLIWVFGLKLGWLPIGGYTSPFEDFWMSTKQLVMPVVCESVLGLASMSRQMRSAVLEVTRQDYIRTAWAKGLRERAVVFRHMLKNCLIPIVTLMGFAIGTIFGGSVLVETVFNIPGMGRLMVNSIFNQDYVVVQATTLIFGAIVLVVNLLVDISYGWLDPRIRYS
ncbi:MAG: ABC transporter permease [Dehalococcoidales bacterium]|nr:ABC transporter permease [Dehalococcoidales bacterium]